jgi:hypothetical protein
MRLTAIFRRSGFQWPLGSGDAVRLYGEAGELQAELPGDLLLALLEYHLTGHALQARVRAAADRPLLPECDARPAPRLRAPAGRRLRGR